MKFQLVKIKMAVGAKKNQTLYGLKLEHHATVNNETLYSNINDMSTFSDADSIGIFKEFANVVNRLNASGFVVDLGELGTLRPQLSAKAVDTRKECIANTIRNVSQQYRARLDLNAEINAAPKEMTRSSDTTSGDTGTTTTTYTLTAVSANTAQGSVSGGGTYAAGTVVTLVATPASGYTFSRWSDGSTEASRQVTVTADATYTAEFAASGSGSMDD